VHSLDKHPSRSAGMVFIWAFLFLVVPGSLVYANVPPSRLYESRAGRPVWGVRDKKLGVGPSGGDPKFAVKYYGRPRALESTL
jgi:hypothetical protein